MNVAIVNDSKTAAEVLRRILTELTDFHHLWTAFSGEEALRLCADSVPDIILMDLVMPGIDGAETTRCIMKSTPCVILVVTATTVGNRDKVFEAMGHGALDAVNTPRLHPGGAMTGAEPLLQKLGMVARLVSPLRTSATAQTSVSQSPSAATDSSEGYELPIVAIGASTGGPQALTKILAHLPADFPAAVLISQHVDEQFAAGLATWLQHHCSLPVRIACAGQLLVPGTVWIAASNDHLMYEERKETGRKKVGFLNYTADPRETAYRPSVDVLFSSLANSHRAPRIGVLLTGMGRDGAEGLLALRNAGSLTIAQDAATSIVYGMPRAAAELKAAVEILPLELIGPRINEAILRSAHHPLLGIAPKPLRDSFSTKK